jgi:hypothetical protein
MNTAQAFREKDRRNIQIIGGGQNNCPKKHIKDDPLYEFDEGDQISFDEGTHGVLVIGGVGRGKTASFMLPMASSLIGNGLPGLIIDIKNNFTDQVRKLAKLASREQDILEIGTHPTATPINLLDGLSLEEAQQLIESLLLSGQEHSSNVDWVHKGVRLLTDMVMLMHFVRQIDIRFSPSFVILDRCINDYQFARNIFKLFMENGYNPADYVQRSFVERVQTSAFHILTAEKHRPKRDYEEQLSYQLYRPRGILGAITSDDSLTTNLSGQNCDLKLDYRELLKAGKIVVLRFKNTQGHAAKLLARYIKEKYYKDVYRTLDDDCAHPDKCFFMADEYQDVINVSPDNSFDDFSWFSKAREFGCINVVATQSLSSLYTNRALRDQVNALVANCSTKIVLQNDDPAADSFFRHFCGLNKTLTQLGSNEALVARFDLTRREQVVKTLRYRQAYEKMQTRLDCTSNTKPFPQKTASHTALMMELDDILLAQTLSVAIRSRPDYMELVAKFREILGDLDDFEIEYNTRRHAEVMEAVQEFRNKFGMRVTIHGIFEINNAGIFLDIDTGSEMREDINAFIRNLLEATP